MEWIALLEKMETPALLMAGVCIAILYRLLVARDKSIDKLTSELGRLSQLISGHNALVSMCCTHGIGRDRKGVDG